MISAASLTSNRVMSGGPVMFHTTPVALSMPMSSRGEEMALRAACCARSLPLPVPCPMREEPAPDMMARTSAKSTLTRPGTVMMSLMPRTPWRSTSSAILNASLMGTLESMAVSSLSLGMTMRVSTDVRRFCRAARACRALWRPSKLKGVVTMPTVRMPSSLATPATIGAAPLPVPPPMPAVTKTMSEPCRAAAISSRVSWAAFMPISGLPPAPRPLVSLDPI
mmetsp:Transcript_26481/g.67328  ORF Transcript_26481/g.67328 Transcript_26481/m.67328 type:complete len:223 (-) Transcript_26481:385-1053(-)